jgi:hypothetical protein
MTTATRNQTDEIQVRELLDRWVKAVCTKDVDALMLSYEPDISRRRLTLHPNSIWRFIHEKDLQRKLPLWCSSI